MVCILCLQDSDKIIHIFEKVGIRLNIENVILKHFWLQPNKNDDRHNSICPSCWDAVDTFHKFYLKVEDTHSNYQNINVLLDCELNNSTESVDFFQEYSSGEKIYHEDTETLPELKLEIPEDSDPLKEIKKSESTEDIRSDSDSEVPLSELAKCIKVESKQTEESNTLQESVCEQTDKSKIPKTKRTEESEDKKGHISEGIWLATCYAQETEVRPTTEELDEYIKLNISLACDICYIPMSTFLRMKEHFTMVHRTKGYATCCAKKFLMRSTLIDHMLTHKLPDYFTCTQCTKKFANRKNLKEHLKNHDKQMIYKCDHCEKCFHKKILLDRHIPIHSSERSFKCEHCDKPFASKFSLGQHIYGVHKGGYTKVCEQCGKVIRDLDSFKRHMLNHTNEPKPFVECDKCGVRLSDRSGLRRHIISQHGETGTFVCKECGYTTQTIFALKRHVTFMHKRQRIFKCNMCDKAFKRALTLKANENDPNTQVICSVCWNEVKSFHDFYKKIVEVHAKLKTTKVIKEDLEFETNDFDTHNIDYNSDIKSENHETVSNDFSKEEEVITKLEIEANIKSMKDTIVSNESDSLLIQPVKGNISTEISKTDDTDIESMIEDDNQQSSETDEESDSSSFSKKKQNKTNKRILYKTHVPCKEFDNVIKQNMKLSCNICQKPLKNFFNLKEHYQSIHKTIGYVTCCDKKFDSRHALVHHIILHQNPEFYKCEKCDKVLTSKKSLKNHMKKHINEEHIHHCYKCKKSFSRQEKLDKHLKTHVTVEQICDQCGKVSKSKQALKQHQLREHSNIPKQRVQCKKCNAYLADASTLHSHMKYLHPEKEVLNVCNICGKISSTAYGLKRHLLYMHTMERSHKCQLCEKAFKTAYRLRPNENDPNSQAICHSCWNALESFHKFYLQIEEAHIKFQNCSNSEEGVLKSDETNAKINVFPETDEPYINLTEFLSADIKLEDEIKHDVERIQSIEVSLSVNTETKTESPQGTSLKIELTDSKKPIDIESTPASSTRSRKSIEKSYVQSDSSSDDEAVYENTERLNSSTDSHNYDNSDDDSDYEDRTSKSQIQLKSEKQTRKRGRPRKNEIRDTPCKRKRSTAEQAKKNERIQEYDDFIAKNMKLSCVICLEIFANFAILKRHYRSAHNECGYVACCGKKFRKRGVLVDHIHQHENPEYFKCEKCGRVLANRKGLDNHMFTHNTEKQRIFQCDQCTMSFYTRPLLTRHLQIHISERNIKCPECDKYFSTQDILRTHINNVHNAAYTRICDQCGKSFRRPDAFRRHQLEHDGITQPLVPCEKCNVKLTSKYGLKRHMESMHPETEVTHMCIECGKIAPSAAALQRHISYMHKMERKYKCPMCDKAFKKTGGLKTNMEKRSL